MPRAERELRSALTGTADADSKSHGRCDATHAHLAGSANHSCQPGLRDLRRAAMLGYAPAFCDSRSGEVHLCLTSTGEIAAIHLFDQLPSQWVKSRSTDGAAVTLAPGIRPGYYAAGRFIDAAELTAQATFAT